MSNKNNNISPTAIKAEAENLFIDNKKQKILRNKKLMETFNDADKQSDPVFLFHEFLSEGTLNIVFGDTGIGKTFLGYHWGFDFSARGYTVIYACLELSEKYLRKRYPTILPSEKFIRLDFNPDYTGQKFEFGSIVNEVRECLENTEGKTILFIDNIKAISLVALNETQMAINIMSELKRLLCQYSKAGRMITIIVFAHIKKTDKYRCIEMNDLSGAKDVQIYLDNLIAMGQSGQDKNLKYLIHLKARNGQTVQDALIIEHCIDNNGNHFLREVEFDDEINHLPQHPETETETINKENFKQAIKLKVEGMSYEKIALALGYKSKGTVTKLFNRAKKNGWDKSVSNVSTVLTGNDGNAETEETANNNNNNNND